MNKNYHTLSYTSYVHIKFILHPVYSFTAFCVAPLMDMELELEEEETILVLEVTVLELEELEE